MSELQSNSLNEKIDILTNGVDLYWKGYDYSTDMNPSSIERYGVQSHINRVLFWLASKPLDFTRSSLRGGVLYNLIGQLNNDTNLEDWKEDIRLKFNSEFSNDLDLLLINMRTDKKYRHLYIEMMVRDRVSNRVFPVATGVEK